MPDGKSLSVWQMQICLSIFKCEVSINSLKEQSIKIQRPKYPEVLRRGRRINSGESWQSIGSLVQQAIASSLTVQTKDLL